ncbi:putative O-acetyltransferase CAS1 [Pseudocercospora fuligena]|uniref:Putative O-acetyltransferase CAS1 n=1 Tax=Pseudocercospora fuligena TaxID=685502 RepID=A0A8H6RPV9_9PEZI|nr:putative O-acetyltransferase CAS1 [Pseudocercospora fuligena]
MFRELFVVTIVALLALQHYIFDDDPYKCRALIKTGHWLAGEWLPSGCGAVQYGSKSLQTCTQDRKRNIVFAGDLQLQGTYYHLVQRMTTSKNKPVPAPRERDLRHETETVSLSFLYDPHLNGSLLMNAVEAFRDQTPESPMLLTIGAANSASESASPEEYLDRVHSITSLAHSRRPNIKLGSRLEYQNGPGDLLLFAPAEQSFDVERSKTFLELNQKLLEASVETPFHFLSAFTEMTTGPGDYLEPGSLLVKEELFRTRGDLLLNLRCNAIIAGKGPNWIQLVTVITLGLVLPVLAILNTCMKLSSSVVRPIVSSFASFGIAILLTHIADRSHVFDHVRKDVFRYENGGMLFLVSLIVGIATIRRSQTDKLQLINHNFLPREQSSEWKGWMQLVIIFYHYGQVAALPVWHFLRICVSSYLFLTGFGHTVFFLQKKDYSLRRFINIMIRLNLLAIILAYTMRTSWVAYYYIPLCTIWFLIVYVTLAVGRQHNSNTLFLLAKIAVAAFLLNKVLYTDGLREALLAFFTTMTKGYFPVSFFDKRVNNDRYIVFVGMAVAPLYLWLTDLIKTQSGSNHSLLATSNEKIPSTRQHSKVDRFILQYWTAIKRTTTITALISLALFWHYRSTLTKSGFSAQQAYTNWLPIICFAILRNAHPIFRNYHSKFFAWVGKYSGEIYILHFHIWLGADQGAVLRTGLFHGDETLYGDRWRDLVVLTPLLLVTAAIVGDATGKIAEWFVKDWGMDEDEKEEVNEKGGLAYLRSWALWPLRTLKRRSILVLFVLWVLNQVYF